MRGTIGIIALLVIVSLLSIGCGSGSGSLVAGKGIIINEIDGGHRISVNIEEGDGILTSTHDDDGAVVISLAKPESMDMEGHNMQGSNSLRDARGKHYESASGGGSLRARRGVPKPDEAEETEE